MKLITCAWSNVCISILKMCTFDHFCIFSHSTSPVIKNTNLVFSFRLKRCIFCWRLFWRIWKSAQWHIWTKNRIMLCRNRWLDPGKTDNYINKTLHTNITYLFHLAIVFIIIIINRSKRRNDVYLTGKLENWMNNFFTSTSAHYSTVQAWKENTVTLA